ncbi:MAG: zinc ribbon domain-containing protein [Magnetococcales bacterium]|jgi:putative FmdB family regulatory protein|nr:zinc ribbon domain-containing protein [Magnetococcales bacterium]
MTLYDYKCDGCGVRFEQDHPMSAPPVRVCPECGAEKVRKILSTGGVQIAGSRPSPSAAPPPCASGGCAGGMCGLG